MTVPGPLAALVLCLTASVTASCGKPPSPARPPKAAVARPIAAPSPQPVVVAARVTATASPASPKPARTVTAASGAIAVGEALPRFLTTPQLSDEAQLRDGLHLLAHSRPTRGLIKLLLSDPTQSRPALLRAIWHEHPNVRSQACLLLVRLGGDGAQVADTLRRSLRKEPDRDVRATAVASLASLKIKALVPVLIEVLREDKAGAVRAKAAFSLGAQDDKRAVPALIAALKDDETNVRLRAVTALHRLRARTAQAPLEKALADPSPLVRKAAVRALKALTGRAYRPTAPE